jgi:hypothetical protein
MLNIKRAPVVSTTAFAIALVLGGWTLLIDVPQYLPRDCVNCGILAYRGIYIKRGFRSEHSCQQALTKWQQDFERELRDTNSVQVTIPKSPKCVPDEAARTSPSSILDSQSHSP